MSSTAPASIASRFRLPAVAIATLALLASPVVAAETLYATGGGPFVSAIYTIDTATGATTRVWDLPDIYAYASGLAYDASSDAFYLTGSTVSDSNSRLFRVERGTGVITSYPTMSPTLNLTGGGLAIHPATGVLYATGLNGFQSSALFTIDKNTGVPTLIGQCGGQCCTAPFGFNMNGLGFRGDGTLFANGFTLSDPPINGAYSYLFTIDIATGQAAHVGLHGVNVGRQLAYSDLAFASNGLLYSMGSTSASTNGLYTIDPLTGGATVIGGMTHPLGCDGGLAFVPDGLPTQYCTAKVNSQGCTPAIRYSGAPSATNPAPFALSAIHVLNQKPGLLLYGYSRASTPFQGGLLCVASPVRRLTVPGSGGSPLPAQDCTGTYSLDFNARIQSGADPLLVPGQEVDAQYWSRDPASPNPYGLTNGVSFLIGA